MYDLAIIGGGPAGYVAAERAGHKGLMVVLFDKRHLGGVCLNEGCIPTKTLLYAAKILDSAREGAKYGILADGVSFDFGKMMQRKDKVVKKLVGGVGAKMKAHKVTVVMENAIIKGRTLNGIEIAAGGSQYEAKNLLICTGSEAFIPPIPGIENAQPMTNREILQLKELPKSLTIIGGGVIGIEFASLYSSLGVKVTVIEMLDEIILGMDREMAGMLRQELVKKGVEFHLLSRVLEVKGNEVHYVQENGEKKSIVSEKILVSTGRKPNIDGFGLENIGVETFKGGIKIDTQCRTNIPNVYAAGDVTGFSLLAHTASREGEVAVNTILGQKDTMRYNAIPAVVYTNPEISGVGLTEESAKAKGIAYKLQSLPMSYAGRFIAENEGKSGLCKVLVGEKYGEVLGVHMLGNPSSEMIYGAAMAIEAGLTVKDMQEIVFPHPTVSEIFKETIFTF
jgi:dihydrolipoamide dehydrogenase